MASKEKELLDAEDVVSLAKERYGAVVTRQSVSDWARSGKLQAAPESIVDADGRLVRRYFRLQDVETFFAAWAGRKGRRWQKSENSDRQRMKDQRKAQILAILSSNPNARIEDLAAATGASSGTVARYMSQLEDEGKLAPLARRVLVES